MSIWRVRVDCMREGKPTPIIRRFIVEAPDMQGAFNAGEAEAKRTALVNTKWAEFKARDAVTINLPLEI